MLKRLALSESDLAQVWGGVDPLASHTVQLGGGNSVTTGPFSASVHLSGQATAEVSRCLVAAAPFVPGPAGKVAGVAGAWLGSMNSEGKGVTITQYGLLGFGPTLVRPH